MNKPVLHAPSPASSLSCWVLRAAGASACQAWTLSCPIDREAAIRLRHQRHTERCQRAKKTPFEVLNRSCSLSGVCCGSSPSAVPLVLRGHTAAVSGSSSSARLWSRESRERRPQRAHIVEFSAPCRRARARRRARPEGGEQAHAYTCGSTTFAFSSESSEGFAVLASPDISSCKVCRLPCHCRDRFQRAENCTMTVSCTSKEVESAAKEKRKKKEGFLFLEQFCRQHHCSRARRTGCRQAEDPPYWRACQACRAWRDPSQKTGQVVR